MSSYHLVLANTPSPTPTGQRWCLDFPQNGQASTLKELRESGVYFQGWLLHAPAQAQLVLKQAGKQQVFPLSGQRADVIERILQQAPEHHPQLHCGFAFHATLEDAEFELGLQGPDFYQTLSTGKVNAEFKVLFGTGGWMFLDNDTNQSVEQHTGRLLLNKDAKTNWQDYYRKVAGFCQQHQLPHLLLIAPSKEAIYPEHYPYPKAKKTPVEQVLDLKPAEFPLVYPVEALRDTPFRSFRLNDTHWSAYGGKVASVLVAAKLGLTEHAVEALFADDQYKGRQSIGDLGNKIYPPRLTEEFFLTNFAHHKFIRYDNELPNFGRVQVIENQQALCDQHLLMFASSSGYTMLDYLSRIYRQITFIHTSGSFDEELALLLKPDAVICQTNARYVLRSPVFGYRLRQVMQDKLSHLSETERQDWRQRKAAQAQLSPLPAVHILQQYFAGA